MLHLAELIRAMSIQWAYPNYPAVLKQRRALQQDAE
jgi:hypothetical protein